MLFSRLSEESGTKRGNWDDLLAATPADPNGCPFTGAEFGHIALRPGGRRATHDHRQ